MGNAARPALAGAGRRVPAGHAAERRTSALLCGSGRSRAAGPEPWRVRLGAREHCLPCPVGCGIRHGRAAGGHCPCGDGDRRAGSVRRQRGVLRRSSRGGGADQLDGEGQQFLQHRALRRCTVSGGHAGGCGQPDTRSGRNRSGRRGRDGGTAVVCGDPPVHGYLHHAGARLQADCVCPALLRSVLYRVPTSLQPAAQDRESVPHAGGALTGRNRSVAWRADHSRQPGVSRHVRLSRPRDREACPPVGTGRGGHA
jgi:hypothetical protein